MAFQVSSGVLVKEIDLTNIVPAVSTSIGAMAGSFNKEISVGEVTAISSEQELEKVFGTPDSNNFETWFTIRQLFTVWQRIESSTSRDGWYEKCGCRNYCIN